MADLGPVLITGCSKGIGRATCERLVRSGHLVYASARSEDSISDLASLGCKTLTLDVGDEESMRRAVSIIEKQDGGVGALVNNAGFGVYGPVEQVALEDARAEFETNVFGLVRLTQLVLPTMRERGRGAIVNVSSVAGRVTFPGGAFYQASKFAVEALSDALRLELAPFGIRVVIVEPGPVRTGWASRAASSIPLEEQDAEIDPYGSFKVAVTSMLLGRQQGLLRHLDSSPAAVARIIEKALTRDRPRARYTVGLPAKLIVAGRALASDRVYDAALRRVFRV